MRSENAVARSPLPAVNGRVIDGLRGFIRRRGYLAVQKRSALGRSAFDRALAGLPVHRGTAALLERVLQDLKAEVKQQPTE